MTMGLATWSFSLLIFAVILAFNLFAMDSIIRMRGDVMLLRKAVTRIVPPTPQEHASQQIQSKALALPADEAAGAGPDDP